VHTVSLLVCGAHPTILYILYHNSAVYLIIKSEKTLTYGEFCHFFCDFLLDSPHRRKTQDLGLGSLVLGLRVSLAAPSARNGKGIGQPPTPCPEAAECENTGHQTSRYNGQGCS